MSEREQEGRLFVMRFESLGVAYRGFAWAEDEAAAQKRALSQSRHFVAVEGLEVREATPDEAAEYRQWRKGLSGGEK